jgi:hypothetical protein
MMSSSERASWKEEFEGGKEKKNLPPGKLEARLLNFGNGPQIWKPGRSEQERYIEGVLVKNKFQIQENRNEISLLTPHSPPHLHLVVTHQPVLALAHSSADSAGLVSFPSLS